MKHNKKTLLLIVGVAIILAAATSASAYYEDWDGWFNSGYLTLGTDTFYYTTGESILEDHTVGDVDEFYVPAVTPSTFTCSTGGEYQGFYIKVWSNPSGSKDTGQEGQKEVNGTPTWTGYAILYRPAPLPDVEFETVGGTWDTGDAGDYFDYTDCPCPPATPTYSAHWILSGSSPPDITEGEGGSEGEQTYYEE
jgi:hypothetical protein